MAWGDLQSNSGGWSKEKKLPEEKTKAPKRRQTALLERTDRHIYRRAFSELKLLDCLNDEKLKEGHSYHFITGGDVDSLSFLMLALRTFKKLDYLLISTWCMANEDVLAIFELYDKGIVKNIDFYVGEIFPGSYKAEYRLLKEKVDERKCGRIAVFKNHSKTFAGISGNSGFYIQSSANINTNPQTEQACITVSKEAALFCKEFYDGIKSFE